VQTFKANKSQSGIAHRLSYASNLFNPVQSMQTAGPFVKEHSPGLVTPAAIRSAANAGVLTPAQARDYLVQIG
jgi:hypothetical protein